MLALPCNVSSIPTAFKRNHSRFNFTEKDGDKPVELETEDPDLSKHGNIDYGDSVAVHMRKYQEERFLPNPSVPLNPRELSQSWRASEFNPRREKMIEETLISMKEAWDAQRDLYKVQKEYYILKIKQLK
ncbi:uncharacterized protein LOC143040682 [Oratosquilla oratoria]|uniref:uncharacterized protein LOC143040682 n=1 Tax=Oratosquilla oratoria TaxID=337810 RepID=UPI003F764B2A